MSDSEIKNTHGGRRKGAGRPPSPFRQALRAAAAERAAQRQLQKVDWNSPTEVAAHRSRIRDSQRAKICEKISWICPGCNKHKPGLRHWLVLHAKHVLERGCLPQRVDRRNLAGLALRKSAEARLGNRVAICRSCWGLVTHDEIPRNARYVDSTNNSAITLCTKCLYAYNGPIDSVGEFISPRFTPTHETIPPRCNCEICGLIRHRDKSQYGSQNPLIKNNK